MACCYSCFISYFCWLVYFVLRWYNGAISSFFCFYLWQFKVCWLHRKYVFSLQIHFLGYLNLRLLLIFGLSILLSSLSYLLSGKVLPAITLLYTPFDTLIWYSSIAFFDAYLATGFTLLYRMQERGFWFHKTPMTNFWIHSASESAQLMCQNPAN